jgi:lipid-A-disaccharide synthase
MAALQRRTDDRVRFIGVGGPRMAALGLDSLFPMEELSVMGAAEVLPHLPRLLRRIRETVAAVVGTRPDAVVTIDAPSFTFRVDAKLRGCGIPLIHYVAPQVWAWKPRRARKIARFLDHLLVLLPFEPPYFTAEGLPCTYVGHPVTESGADRGDGEAFRRRHRLADAAPLLCLLPGSRRSEARRLLPVFGRAAALLRNERPHLHAVVPTVAVLFDEIAAAVADWAVPATVVCGDGERFDAFAAADGAIAASGTVALELAMAGTPTVITYKMNAITGWLARRVVRLPFVSLVNLLAEGEVFPELLQGDCRPENLAATLCRLLDDPAARADQATGAARAIAALGLEGPTPSERAAAVVLSVIAEKQQRPLLTTTAATAAGNVAMEPPPACRAMPGPFPDRP